MYPADPDSSQAGLRDRGIRRRRLPAPLAALARSDARETPPTRIIICLAVSLAVGLAFLSEAEAVTIYRIGGESLPEPDPEAMGAPADSVKFEQLSWEDVVDAPLGSSHLVEIFPDSLRPDFIGNRNILFEVEDRGGFIKARCICRGGYAHDRSMAVIYDGDPETAYVGQPPTASGASNLQAAGAPVLCAAPRRRNRSSQDFVQVRVGGHDRRLPAPAHPHLSVSGNRGSQIHPDIHSGHQRRRSPQSRDPGEIYLGRG